MERALGMGGYVGSPAHKEDKQAMIQKIAELIAPEEWKEFNSNNGVVTNQSSCAIKDSLFAAKRIFDALIDSDFLHKHFHENRKRQ